MNELRQAAQEFEARTKTGGKNLWSGKIGYRVMLTRVTGAKLVRDAGGLGVVGNIYNYGIVVNVFLDGPFERFPVELEAEARMEADFRGIDEPYLVVNDIEAKNDAGGWGKFIADAMWDDQDWVDELPLPF